MSAETPAQPPAPPPLFTRVAAGLVAATAWFALVLLFAVVAAKDAERGRTLLQTTLAYFGFFTTLTNLLIAVGLACWAVAPRSRVGAFFGRPATTAATALYIAVVAVVYTLFLRRIWTPTGWLKVADVLLHDVVPASYVACWALLLPKGGLPWATTLRWLAYPTGYFAYTLALGAYAGRYPYPFFNVTRLGYGLVMVNGLGLLMVFLLLGLAFVALDRRLARRR